MTHRPLHVLVVDDSAVVREAMSAILTSVPGFTVATAADPVIARRRMVLQQPAVIVLDLEMPREGGLAFLKDVMAFRPTPVVICSSHCSRGSRAALEALHEGAVDVIAKPQLGVREFMQDSAVMFLDTIRAAARARIIPRSPFRVAPTALSETGATASTSGAPSRRVIGIAASTGGPRALGTVLAALPPDIPGLLVVQHMPPGFTTTFARSLAGRCRIGVREAADGDPVLDGYALIAPGNRHLRLHREAAGLVVEVADGPLVSRHRPSADALFESLARQVGPHALGVILTGMGSDGADGLRAMREAGARTIAQDEASSVVFGMPMEAIARGAATDVLPLDAIAADIARWAGRRMNLEPMSHD